MSDPAYTPPFTSYILIDGDGHTEIAEADLSARILDLVLSNSEVSFKVSHHTHGGMPLVVIEVTQ